MKNGILFDLYTDSFPSDTFKNLPRHSPSDRAKRLIEDYRELVADYPPDKLEQAPRVPDELMKNLKTLGLFGINIPKEYGGLGLNLSDYLYIVSVMAEEDMSLAIVPLAHLSIGMKGILLFGNDEQKERYLTPAATGDMIFAYALTEPKTGSDARHIQTSARRSEDGSGYLLNGTKAYITNGGYADGFTVFARIEDTEEGTIGAFVVERSMDGVTIGKDLPKMGLHISSTTPVILKNVQVPKKNMLGSEGDGFKIAMTILNYGRLGLGAASAGVIRKSAVDMRDRAGKRSQFGMTINNFPLIQEKIGTAKIVQHAVWGMTLLSAAQLQQSPLANLASEGSHTKLFGTTAAWNVLYDALQVAGGAGYLRTLPYEKRTRDFRVTTVFEGTSEIHSIYPPLAIMRELSNDLKKGGKLSAFFKLAKVWLKPVLVSLPSMQGIGGGVSSEIRKNATLVRRMELSGMVRYGEKIATQEFYLRSITLLSVNIYVLLGLVHSFPSASQQERREITTAIRYYLIEARRLRRETRSALRKSAENITVESFTNFTSGVPEPSDH